MLYSYVNSIFKKWYCLEKCLLYNIKEKPKFWGVERALKPNYLAHYLGSITFSLQVIYSLCSSVFSSIKWA